MEHASAVVGYEGFRLGQCLVAPGKFPGAVRAGVFSDSVFVAWILMQSNMKSSVRRKEYVGPHRRVTPPVRVGLFGLGWMLTGRRSPGCPLQQALRRFARLFHLPLWGRGNGARHAASNREP